MSAKYTEIKYSRVFNLGDYEKEEISIGFVVDENATLDTIGTEIEAIQKKFREVSVKTKMLKAKQAQGGK
jgi:hypothetical protein